MWVSAFAVYITQSSLTCQFEHSGKGMFGPGLNLALEDLFSLLSGSASFSL